MMANNRHHGIQQLPTIQLNITTLNVNGLHIDNKRMDTFKLIRNRKIYIAFLQETHSTPESVKSWEKD